MQRVSNTCTYACTCVELLFGLHMCCTSFSLGTPVDTLWSPVFDTVNMFALLRESQLLMADGNNGPLDLNR